MGQITVKNAVDAWIWLAENSHHEVGTEFRADGSTLAVYFCNHHQKMRVPEALTSEVFSGIEPNKRAFDTRMYGLKRKARAAIRKAAEA